MFSSLFRRALAGLGFSILLGGCNSRPAPPIATAPRAARPAATSTPRATPKPLPAWRKKPHVVYGIQTKKQVLALTFDDGPDPTWTPKVLAILQQTKTPATFFMVGKMVRAHPRWAHMVQDAHFPIGNHSWSHPSRPRNPRAEIELTDAILGKTLHIKPTLFRPPYGLMKNGLATVALSRGEDVINWNSLGSDWDKHSTSASIEAKVLQGACAGGITLLHDGGGNRSKTVAALPHIIARLRARGYSFVTVSQLLLMGPPVRVGGSRASRPKHRKRAAKSLKVKASSLARAKPPTVLPSVPLPKPGAKATPRPEIKVKPGARGKTNIIHAPRTLNAAAKISAKPKAKAKPKASPTPERATRHAAPRAAAAKSKR